MPDEDDNPYAAPQETHPNVDAHTCSFCGESPGDDGTLMAGLSKDVYICVACARYGAGAITQHERYGSILSATGVLFVGILIVFVIVLNWLWDDEGGVGPVLSIVGLGCGLFCIGHFVLSSRYRWKHRSR